jgi:hypothetical protein
MRKTFMVSVAVAALFAATGFAAAQGVNPSATKGSESPAAASPKGDAAAPANAPAAKGEAATPGAAKHAQEPQHAQDKGEASGAGAHGKPDTKTTGEMKPDSSAKVSDSSTNSKDMKHPTAETKSPADGKTTGEIKTDSKSKASDSTAPTTNSKDMKNPTAETKSPADSKTTGEIKTDSKSKASDSTAPTTNSKDVKNPTAETKSPTAEGKTTGNAATSATAATPAEKQTQIVSAIRQEKVEEVTNVNFNISIGTAVPSHVHYYPLPSRIVEIYPEWRGYDFIRVGGRYIILRPQTHEIVYIIEG